MAKGEMGKQQREAVLIRAALDGNLRLLKKMARGLASGAQGEAAVLAAVADDEGNRALHMAAAEGRVEVCRYLVQDLRLDVNQPNDSGGTPLFLAAFFGRASCTRYLLDHGADPLLVCKLGSPLHAAAESGHCEVVEFLLSRGIDVNLDSPIGSPLHAAAIGKQEGTMKILLEHHANVGHEFLASPLTAKEDRGDTFLQPSKVRDLDFTPLNWVIRPEAPEYFECVKLLTKAGADVNFIDSHGISYVMMAADFGLPGVMKCLLDAGANPNIPDEFGTTPIEVAASKGRREIVEMLFPLTSPIPLLPEWSIDGIISHVKSFGLRPRDKRKCEKKISELKLRATEAFKRKEYSIAGQLYSTAMEFDPSPDESATLLANRSLCWLRTGDGEPALYDANHCRSLRPQWPKACYRQGAALMLLKEYEKACEAFADSLNLDPKNGDIANALREAREALKNARCSEK